MRALPHPKEDLPWKEPSRRYLATHLLVALRTSFTCAPTWENTAVTERVPDEQRPELRRAWWPSATDWPSQGLGVRSGFRSTLSSRAGSPFSKASKSSTCFSTAPCAAKCSQE